MEFFATGGFQQLYNDLEESAATQDFGQQYLMQEQQSLDFCYADVNFGNGYETNSMDYYGITTLDSNNNYTINNIQTNSNNNNSDSYSNSNNDSNFRSSNSSVEHELPFDFDDPELAIVSILGDSSSPPDLTDWEQRLLDHFVEIPELTTILPERTPLCTDMCDDFLQESNNNLRLVPSTSPVAMTATATPLVTTLTMVAPLQLSENAAGEKGYLCTFGNCEKLYAKPAHLKAHMRRHLGEKPYACSWPECSWRFSRSDELARHRRSHSGVKPYKCDYCAKCFARSDHLTKHRKVHERRLLAATRSGKLLPNGPLPQSVYAVRPGRKRKNQL
ncbi:Krueppel-like factor luna [Drosophila grimshawi]|uniref:GH12832 n=1 Tax=Drosophila grimshawi TaxID=7222 RepID=B4JLC8_DROGR|nr:Krueppel-like factor luna [Drosophila grimshawi]EDW00381.1 GH12832 [Drosophila grimshawi]